MPTTFLSLPRELRDQIYEYILISPSLHIEPALLRHPTHQKRIPHYSPSRLEPQPRFALCTNPLDTLPLDPVTQQPVSAYRHHTSLSIRRVCRQITLETAQIFWCRNTFYFSTFYLSAVAVDTTDHDPDVGVIVAVYDAGEVFVVVKFEGSTWVVSETDVGVGRGGVEGTSEG
ncbi:uncharacterized protein LY89DRAFT_784360 [Mollisia scopiformis]|uniref:DUF7730 domain-containing protein n=1 Tax=Mollisia scopiformis TaxID=149040 RepID=A0A194X2J5_MOLSC|nr:uncharacterized protein LY89DRAFT_784360 [Mollisia scopiformis]KUJ14411.1 hypothetical protein LY89DRAFT_784360 [Mollisia scopiformis]